MTTFKLPPGYRLRMGGITYSDTTGETVIRSRGTTSAAALLDFAWKRFADENPEWYEAIAHMRETPSGV